MAELLWRGKTGARSFAASPETGQQTAPTPTPHLLTVNTHGPPEQDNVSPSHSLADGSWYNRLICGDRREVLPALLHEFRASVDLIYIDPPFMTGRIFTNGVQVAYQDVWNNDKDSYLQWLYETLVLLHALLAPDGSLYVHLDWHIVHYAKVMLDEIFDADAGNEGGGFKNEIIWHYQSGGRAQKCYARKHDTLLLYTRSAAYCFHGERIGERRGTHKRNHMRKEVSDDGRVSWTIRSAGRVYTYDQDTRMTPSDVWSDINHLHQKDPERTGYATQKPEALLERVLLASSEADDLVLDCFCGSGVTPVVAERLGRRWIACDQNEAAITMTHTRLLDGQEIRPFVWQQVSTA